MDGGAWWATVHRVAKSRMRLSDLTFTFFNFQLSPKGTIELPGGLVVKECACHAGDAGD